jgi:hypothetical protein
MMHENSPIGSDTDGQTGRHSCRMTDKNDSQIRRHSNEEELKEKKQNTKT